mgnify:CR=1 FL=1
MKTFSTLFVTAALIPSLASAFSIDSLNPVKIKNDEERLACEAIMCLSSPGSSPAQCHPSLRKYFSIKFKHGHDTLNARRNFLKKCPVSNNKEVSGMIDSVVR